MDGFSCVNERNNLFQNILLSRGLSDADKSPERMAQDAFEVIVAGVETTSRSLTAATYYVLSKPETVLPRLREELENAPLGPDSRISLKSLEGLPWLVSVFKHSADSLVLISFLQTAIIKETLRVGGATTARMPRISPHSPLLYKNWIIPPGVGYHIS